MKRLLLIACLMLGLSAMAQPESLTIVPKNNPGDNWALDPSGRFHFCYEAHRGAIISAESSEIMDWIQFCSPILSVCYSEHLLLVQTEFDGCLYDLRSFQAVYSTQYKGSAGAIDLKKSQVFVAYENNLHLPPGASSILIQQNAPNGIFKVVDFDGELQDSLILFTRYPENIKVNGKRIEVSGPIKSTKTEDKVTFVVEEFDLRNKKIERSKRELTPAVDIEINRPKPLYAYANKILEAYFHEASGNLVLYGGGASEGGAVKSWNLYSGEFLWAVSVESNLNPIRGFTESGELLGDSWLLCDTLDANTTYAELDRMSDASGKPKYIKAITQYDLKGRRAKVLTATERNSLNLDSLSIRYLSLRDTHCGSISTPDFEIRFDGGSMNFELSFPGSDLRLHFLCFADGNWMIHDESGVWTGSENARNFVNFFTSSGMVPAEMGLNQRNEALIRSHFKGENALIRRFQD